MTTHVTRIAGFAVGLLAAGPAAAHHLLGGAPMQSFQDGLFSGLGHPILGFDHLFFVVAMGVAAALLGRARVAPAAYIGAMAAGCLMTAAGLGLPLREIVIALSLVVLGGLVLSGRALAPGRTLALFAGFGLFHGSAFGVSIAGQEAGMGAQVLIGYLIGLAAIQYAIALAAGWAARRVAGAEGARTMPARLTGAAVAGAGLLLTLESLEGLALVASGLTG